MLQTSIIENCGINTVTMFQFLYIILIFCCCFNNVLLVKLERISTYQGCSYDSDCRENSYCKGNSNVQKGVCECKQGYELLDRNNTYYRCAEALFYGDGCLEDLECLTNLGVFGECAITCRCKEGSHYKENRGRCFETVLINDLCQADDNCYLIDGDGNCVDGRCSCPPSTVPSKARNQCIKQIKIGEICDNDDQCLTMTPNSRCNVKCECDMYYNLDNTLTTCLPSSRKFGGNCTEDSQCHFLRDSICIDKKCSCNDGYHGYGLSCVKTAEIGEPCGSIGECILHEKLTEIVNCTEGVCVCLQGDCSKANGAIFFTNVFIVLLSIFLNWCK